MKIKEIGGEFKLIEIITCDFKNYHGVTKTIGDDAAVVKTGDHYQVISTDTLVEGDHFNLEWFTPYQIGLKTFESNLSDIAAMGARPEFLLLNLVLRDDVEFEFVKEIYKAIKDGCDRYKITLLGGDTTHGPAIMLSATITGTTAKPIFRSGARVGDIICVTGDVGGSSAGFKSFRSGKKPKGYVLKRYLEPKSRYDISDRIAAYANSMIDISDGVASEVRHICEGSKTGATVYADKIPIHPKTSAAARGLGISALECALSGGEDYELLFTIDKNDLAPLQKKVSGITVIGEILSRTEGTVLINPNGRKSPLPKGYDHFAK